MSQSPTFFRKKLFKLLLKSLHYIYLKIYALRISSQSIRHSYERIDRADIPITAQSDNSFGIVNALDGDVVGLDVADECSDILTTGISGHGELVGNLNIDKSEVTENASYNRYQRCVTRDYVLGET